VIHVLGSDIPHHNATVLRFFNDVLAAEIPGTPIFWVAAADPAALGHHPALEVVVHPNRPTLARTLISLASQDRDQCFFLHGQFSPEIWLALLTGSIRTHQVRWHIWGADLYETANGLRPRMFYPLRRMAQGRVGQVFGTLGDIEHYQARHPRTSASLLYFPTRIPHTHPRPAPADQAEFTVLIGNSGDRSNRHVEALRTVHRHFGPQTRIVIPFGSPASNEKYAEQVRAEADRLFPSDNVLLLTRQIGFEEYSALLAQCDLGYLIFRRQQGIGTLCLLIRQRIPCVVSRDNPFTRDLADQGVPVLFEDDQLDMAQIAKARHRLADLALSEISFFPDNCVTGWRRALAGGQVDVRR